MVMIAWVVKLIEFIGLNELIKLVELFESNIQPINLVNSQPCVLPSILGPIPET